MMKRFTTILNVGMLLWVLTALFVSCRSNDRPKHQVSQAEIEEHLINQNRKRLELEMVDIAKYIEDKGWPMKESATGLWYWLYEDFDGQNAAKGDKVSIRYSIELLDGSPCYASEAGKPLSFIVEGDQIESGIHEGIQRMSVGDRAKFVLPSHLAWGFTGDQVKIPKNATLVYDVELLEVN